MIDQTRNAEVGTRNGTGHGPMEPPVAPPVFDAAAIELQRRMRFNPLRSLTPENLSTALDQFDLGILRQAALLWDAMARRDDTLSFVKPQLENALAGKPWGVFKRKNADEGEAARHAACLEYFWDGVTAVNAWDRNERGGRKMLLRQMGAAYAERYAMHHIVWKPEPGNTVTVEGVGEVPVISAELEYVPLWFFENVSGTLRFLPFGGFGIHGQELNWDGEWICTTGIGIMFAASICYTFKRLTFQDWTVFNERYGQSKVLGQTPARQDSIQGQAFAQICGNFNGDQAIVMFESPPGSEPPIRLLGPEGAASVELFEKFLERQDRKMAVMFRGSDLRNMSREKETTGVSAQNQETEALELAHCENIAEACRKLDRMVIRYCFGEGVEPLAYFGLPDMDQEDAKDLRESAGFLADRGALVELDTVAERLGVTLTEDPDEALQAVGAGAAPEDAADGPGSGKNGSNGKNGTATANAMVEELAKSPYLKEAARFFGISEQTFLERARAKAVKEARLAEIVEAALLTTANAFNEDELRDEDGKWTIGAEQLGPITRKARRPSAEEVEFAEQFDPNDPETWGANALVRHAWALQEELGEDAGGGVRTIIDRARAAAQARIAAVKDFERHEEGLGARATVQMLHDRFGAGEVSAENPAHVRAARSMVGGPSDAAGPDGDRAVVRRVEILRRHYIARDRALNGKGNQ